MCIITIQLAGNEKEDVTTSLLTSWKVVRWARKLGIGVRSKGETRLQNARAGGQVERSRVASIPLGALSGWACKLRGAKPEPVDVSLPE